MLFVVAGSIGTVKPLKYRFFFGIRDTGTVVSHRDGSGSRFFFQGKGDFSALGHVTQRVIQKDRQQLSDFVGIQHYGGEGFIREGNVRFHPFFPHQRFIFLIRLQEEGIRFTWLQIQFPCMIVGSGERQHILDQPRHPVAFFQRHMDKFFSLRRGSLRNCGKPGADHGQRGTELMRCGGDKGGLFSPAFFQRADHSAGEKPGKYNDSGNTGKDGSAEGEPLHI